MSPYQITLLLEIHTRGDMKTSAYWSGPAYSNALKEFASMGLIEGRQIDLDCPVMTERGRAYVDFLQAMPLPVANWAIPGPWAPSMPPGHQNEKEQI